MQVTEGLDDQREVDRGQGSGVVGNEEHLHREPDEHHSARRYQETNAPIPDSAREHQQR